MKSICFLLWNIHTSSPCPYILYKDHCLGKTLLLTGVSYPNPGLSRQMKNVQEQLDLRYQAQCISLRTASSLILKITVKIMDGSESEFIWRLIRARLVHTALFTHIFLFGFVFWVLLRCCCLYCFLIVFVLQASQARLHYLSRIFKKIPDFESMPVCESQTRAGEEGQWSLPSCLGAQSCSVHLLEDSQQVMLGKKNTFQNLLFCRIIKSHIQGPAPWASG